jgi:hypothetical protein
MANTINIPKTHVIMGLSLPLAILLGYFLAEPMELGSIAVVVMVLSVLMVPLLLRLYYPAMVFCWNAAIAPIFLPGRPALWAVLAFVGLGIALLTRAVNPKARFLHVPSLTKPMLWLLAVVIGTAMLTGGIGVRSLGSDTYGGRKYFYIVAAVAGYFVFTSRRIPLPKAGLYVALYFLSGMTDALADLILAFGPKFSFLLAIFGSEYAALQGADEMGPVNPTMVRLGGLGFMAGSLYTYLLARYGIRGLLDFSRPWRIVLFTGVFIVGLAGGFRSFVILFGLICAILFYMEGLHRTRYLALLLGAGILGAVIVLPQAHRLPMVAQRSLSFLPGQFNALAVENAKASTNWRVEMWMQILPDVPRYLFRGKGYALDANDLYMALQSGSAGGLESTMLSGDYHSGPLSVIIPFGIYGAIAFIWFLVAGLRYLHRVYRCGNQALGRINALIYASFGAHALYFFIGFGSLHSDMAMFTGLLGLSVALNGTEAELASVPATSTDVGSELKTEYIRA